MINSNTDSSSTTTSGTARILDRDLDQLAVSSVLLDQDGHCARCDRTGLLAGVNAHGWTITDDDGNALLAVLCGRCSAPRRALDFMAELAEKVTRARKTDRSEQTLGLAEVFTGNRRSRRDVEHEPTTSMTSDELPPGGLDVHRPAVGYVTGVQ